MSNQKNQVLAFTIEYSDITSRLLSDATLVYDIHNIEVKALWDTGATGTCISTDVVDRLSLTPTGKMMIATPSGSKQVNTYLIDIILPNNVVIQDVVVCDSDIGNQGIDVLIGMDIIVFGDFTISNYNDKTIFSFRIPSSATTDYVKQVQLSNKIGQPHGRGNKKYKKKK